MGDLNNTCFKVDEENLVSSLNQTPIFVSYGLFNRFNLVRVIHGDLPTALVIIGLFTFVEVKLHPPSSIIRNVIQ